MFVCCAYGRYPDPILNTALILLLVLWKSLTFLRLLWDSLLELIVPFKLQTKPYNLLIFSSRLPFVSLKNFWKYHQQVVQALFKNIYCIGACFKASFSTTFAPEYSRGSKKLKCSAVSYTFTPLYPETVNRTYFATTTFIYVVPCISIHCNWQNETYCVGNIFLKCNVTTLGITIFSNTSSPLFVTWRTVMNSMNDCSIGLCTG